MPVIASQKKLWRRKKPIFKIFAIAKLITILLLAFSFNLSAKGFAQNVTIFKRNASLEEVFREIKKQTDYTFVYKEALLEKAKKVTITVKNATIIQVLEECFKNQQLLYTIVNKMIVVREKVPVIQKEEAHALPLPPPEANITGRVTNDKGELLGGATITEKGTRNSVVTNADGTFSINTSSVKTTLVISYVGHDPKEVAVNNQTSINVSLVQATSNLNDVVVVGYGRQRRSDLTGSVASVKTGELQQTPISSIDQGLVGRASGVMVTQTSGMPGATASIRIRGASSLQGGNEPLYVIDGVPVYSGSGFGETGGSTRMSALSTINPNDIESIEILKDASATAIYGSRAANGVILITTKTGKNGRDVISYDAYYGKQSVVKTIDLMDARSYANLVNEAYANDGLAQPYSADFISKIPNGGKGTDWQHEIFRSAPIQNHQLSFSGGDEKSTYAASLNYLDQQGIIINSDLKRYSGRINFNRKMGERFQNGQPSKYQP